MRYPMKFGSSGASPWQNHQVQTVLIREPLDLPHDIGRWIIDAETGGIAPRDDRALRDGRKFRLQVRQGAQRRVGIFEVVEELIPLLRRHDRVMIIPTL